MPVGVVLIVNWQGKIWICEDNTTPLAGAPKLHENVESKPRANKERSHTYFSLPLTADVTWLAASYFDLPISDPNKFFLP